MSTGESATRRDGGTVASECGFATPAEAEHRVRHIGNGHRGGAHARVPITLDEWLPRRWTTPDLDEVTIDNYRCLVDNHIAPRFGRDNLSDIHASAVSSWSAELHAHHEHSTVRGIVGLLSRILGDAAEDGLLPGNPVHRKRVRASGTSSMGTVQRAVFSARHAGLRSGGLGTDSDDIGRCEFTGLRTAAKILSETAGIDRFTSKDASARRNGTAPLPVWSSNRARHRLARTGNRQLNAALHRIALAQAPTQPNAKTMIARRKAVNELALKLRRDI